MTTDWTWTCMECGATGPMPDDILAPQHDCKSRGPFDEVSRLLVEPVTGSSEPSPRVHPAHEARLGHPGEPCRDRSICYPGDRSSDPS